MFIHFPKIDKIKKSTSNNISMFVMIYVILFREMGLKFKKKKKKKREKYD